MTEKIREITDYYQNQMRETHSRHMARVEEIRREQFMMGLAVATAILLPIALAFFIVWLRR